jgi:acetyl-CoA carboxylase carboxyl transferase subunit alpha
LAEAKEKGRTGLEQGLPFERKILELESRLADCASDEERESVSAALAEERRQVFENLTPWQRVQLARHGQRPRMLDYTSRILEDLVELHGDRALGDDPAMVAGVGRFQGQTVVVVGQQKGVSTEEKVKRNFGMAHPEGYRKALRMFDLAERLHLPVLTFVDTPAAHPGIEAEAHGQGPMIAHSLRKMMSTNTPIFSVILAEGGSGGALAVAVADWVAMMEHAIYVICPPERCAEILWKDVEKKEIAASAMRVTAQELLELGAIDAIVPEPPGGAHRDPDGAAGALAEEIDRFLAEAKKGSWSLEKRRRKFRNMGVFEQPG